MGDSVTNTAAKAVTKTTSSAQPGERNYVRAKGRLYIDDLRSFQETARVDDDASLRLPRHLLLELRAQGPGGERGAAERAATRAHGPGGQVGDPVRGVPGQPQGGAHPALRPCLRVYGLHQQVHWSKNLV